MYEIEEIEYCEALDVDSSYASNDVENSKSTGSGIAIGLGIAAGLGLAVYGVNELTQVSEYAKDVLPYHETLNYIGAAYEDGQGLSQAEVDTILAKTKIALEAVESVDNATMIQGVHDKVLYFASQDYEFSDIERQLLETIKELKK